jgi:CRISPR-associated protein Cas1
MLNEFTYCPRLCYLEWVHGEFRDSADTVEGRYQHRRVDSEENVLPDAEYPDPAADKDASISLRSVMISGPRTGVIARIDLVEMAHSRTATPVDYKRGQAPTAPSEPWEPERVQLCAQGLVLRENGYECERGIIYYAQSRTRVTVEFTADLISRTEELIRQVRETVSQDMMPPPLADSPKCIRCSLVGICLPDETNLLAGGSKDGVRRLVPARDDALSAYAQTQGMTVCKRGDILEFRQGKEVVDSVRLLDASQLSVFGNIQITAQALRELCARGIPTCHLSYGGWFYGITQGFPHKNVELRVRQYSAALSEADSLAMARHFVSGKIRNCRTMLRRNLPREGGNRVLRQLGQFTSKAESAEDLGSLLGIEGSAARAYFGSFAEMLKPKTEGLGTFDFEGRNRRPPRDPVNALLSFLYSLMVKDLTVTLVAVGFDPFMGFFHQRRYGRPALALDLMEEFRPIIGDSVVIGLINNGEVSPDDFISGGNTCALTVKGRKKVITAYERRLDVLIRHPVFQYAISYRRVLEVQARLLARALTGEIPNYPPFTTR